MRAIAILLLLASEAWAVEPVCEEPARIGLRDLLVGAPRSPCAAREFAARLRGVALIDTPDFYGTLDAAMLLGARLPVGPLELSVDARVVDWRFVQNASVIATELGVGPVAVGALWPMAAGRVRFAPGVRVVLPFTDSAMGEPEVLLEAGVHAAMQLSPRVVVSGSAGVHGFVVAAEGGAHGRVAAAIAPGVAYAPWRWLRLLGGAELEVGWYGGGLDHLLGRGGVGVVAGKAGRFELVAAVPVVGEERTDVVAGLDWMLGW